MIGRSLGHYRIDRKLGEGGVGVVYRAVDERLDRPVALKVLLSELHARQDVVERFRSEARTLAQLHHPNIATLFGFEEADGELFMVMEFVEGMTLASLTQRGGGLPLEHVLPIFFQALEGVGHAHELGIIHRDIKGSNLMLDTRGRLKVMDFGIARIVGSQRHTLLGHVVGTPEFMAPEQIRGEETDVRSDIYALGCLLYLLLTGRPPFAGGSGFELMRAQVEQKPPSLRERVPDLPEDLEPVLSLALEKDPARRIASCSEFRERLEAVAPSAGVSPGPIPLAHGLSPAGPTATEAALDVTRELDLLPESDDTTASTGDALAAAAATGSPSEAPTHAHPVLPSPARFWRRPSVWVSAALLTLGLNAVWWKDTDTGPGPAPIETTGAGSPPGVRLDGDRTDGVDPRAGDAVAMLAPQPGARLDAQLDRGEPGGEGRAERDPLRTPDDPAAGPAAPDDAGARVRAHAEHGDPGVTAAEATSPREPQRAEEPEPQATPTRDPARSGKTDRAAAPSRTSDRPQRQRTRSQADRQAVADDRQEAAVVHRQAESDPREGHDGWVIRRQ